jgi:hypothetical protein
MMLERYPEKIVDGPPPKKKSLFREIWGVTPETVTEVDVHGTFDRQPVKAHESKRDRLKARRASMFPPVLDSPSIRARLDLAADAPPLPPAPPAGRNSSCSSTFPGENQHPRPGQEPTEEANGKPTTVPMGSRTMTAPTTATHGSASLTDAPRLTTMTGALRNTCPSCTTFNHPVRTGSVSMCHPWGRQEMP